MLRFAPFAFFRNSFAITMNLPARLLHRLVLPALGSLALGSFLRAQIPQPAEDPESPAAREARIQWFREAKFGLFIHWGLYAVTEGEWKGQPVPGIGA